MPRISFSPCIKKLDYPGLQDFKVLAATYISQANEKREGKHKRRTLTPPVWTEGQDITVEVYVYLFAIGFRMLNDMHENRVLTERPSVDSLSQVLLEHALTFTPALMDSHEYSRKASRLQPGDPARLARNAAEKVVREWRWTYVEMKTRAGRRGAQERVYAKTYTLEDLESVQHIKSKQGQAEALGCSTATIARLRREWNEQQAQNEKQRQAEAEAQQVDRLLAEVLAEVEVEPTPEPLSSLEQELATIRAERHAEFMAADRSWLDELVAT